MKIKGKITAPAVSPSPPGQAPFAALQYRDFRLLWIGQLISEIGTQMQMVANNWQIYVLTHFAFALGLMGFVRFIPIVVFSLIGGVFADTVDRRRILLATQSAMTLCAAMLGFLSHTRAISALTIYLLTGLSAAASAFDAPARQALPPNLVAANHLTNALSLNNIMRKTASNIGKKSALLMWAFVIYGAATMLYGISHWFLLSMLFLALIGAADTFSTILRNNIRQLITPDRLRGRMGAVNMIFPRGGPQLGNLEAGIVASWIGAPLSVITGGLSTLIAVAIVAWWIPDLMHYHDEM